MGSRGQYRDMTSLHVSEDLRGHGAGRQLFLLAKDWARDHGAEKLYISSHSAVETQRFYESMGCVDAEEVMEEHVRQEPYDRQLECPADGPGKTDRLLLAMIRYDAGDARRIQHLTKVYEYAGLMGRMERLKKEDQEILEAAAIVHDTVETMVETLARSQDTKSYGAYIGNLNPDEQYELIRELLEPEFGPM